MVSKAIHFGHSSGLSVPLFPWIDFISLQLTRTSWTLEKIAAELESNLLLLLCKLSAPVRNARSLDPIFGNFSSIEAKAIGFNSLIRNRMQLGDSKRWSSWPWPRKYRQHQDNCSWTIMKVKTLWKQSIFIWCIILEQQLIMYFLTFCL